jgi:hypothetical protein
MKNYSAVDGTPLAYVIYDEVSSRRTCMANIGPDDHNYHSCGKNLRVLKDGTYKCKDHGQMLA